MRLMQKDTVAMKLTVGVIQGEELGRGGNGLFTLQGFVKRLSSPDENRIAVFGRVERMVICDFLDTQ